MAGLLALLSVGAWAEERLCAVVLIEITQELTLEQQAFEATMRISNDLDTSLDTLRSMCCRGRQGQCGQGPVPTRMPPMRFHLREAFSLARLHLSVIGAQYRLAGYAFG
jgi:hypothetical protein